MIQDNRSIFIATLGVSFGVIPELVAVLHPPQEDFWIYKNYSDKEKLQEFITKQPLDEIWIATTSDKDKDIKKLHRWLELVYPTDKRPTLYAWCPKDLHDVQTKKQADHFRELVFRLVLRGRDLVGRKNLYLSLAGGRKTMSADMQEAATLFGCASLLHIIEAVGFAYFQKTGNKRPNDVEDFVQPFGENLKDIYIPLQVPTHGPNSIYVGLQSKHFPVPVPTKNSLICSFEMEQETSLLRECSRLQKASSNLFGNYQQELLENQQNNFLALYTLPHEKIDYLRRQIIGMDQTMKEEDLQFLQKLPKAELHCHLGGVLHPREMLHVINNCPNLIKQIEQRRCEWEPVLIDIQKAIARNDAKFIKEWIDSKEMKWKYLRTQLIKNAPEPIMIGTFLYCFRDNPSLLENVVYYDIDVNRSLTDKNLFVGFEDEVGSDDRKKSFARYEQLGDLQGSALLQCEETIYQTTLLFLQRCVVDNVLYIEIRCSPQNYTRGGLTDKEVVKSINRAIDDVDDITVRLIIIGSRHGDPEHLQKHVDMTVELSQDDLGRSRIIGFDLAGAEEQGRFNELRQRFLPLHKECLPITIHAGETLPAESIWNAVYELQADRIGHGLTLIENRDLMKRIRNRRIGVELCPSSNLQIVGFYHPHISETQNLRQYPLKEYLDFGLDITINTDNPGISRTSLSLEYYTAACMSGGLSKWDIFILIRNAFRRSFAEHDEKSKLLRLAEKKIIDILQNIG